MARRTITLAQAIGRRLTAARRARGLTVRELARLALCTPGTVQRIGSGTSINPGVGTLWDLARALEVDPLWLIGGVGEGVEETKAGK